ncbi:hypothetical protein GCM10027605_62530 [Micromonospora zhanjiangensis]
MLDRRYRLIDQVGAGGMSVIWRARDEVLDRVVAVKVLAASLAADARFRDLVREEARAAAQLVHPHVTSVHDYGETVAPDGTITAYVVMELLRGEELEARLTAGPLPWPEAVQVCAQVAGAVAAAHRIGIVHRDVTPANVMLTSAGAKVLDFGIATRTGAPDEDSDGQTFGTPAYVAPERLDGTPAQAATDTYSLGVLLFETLTGRTPFPAETWEELARVSREGPIPAPWDVPDLPPAVAEICQRCLAPDPIDRPTAQQVADVLGGQLSTGRPARPPIETVPRPPAERPAGRPAYRPSLPLVLTAAAVAALSMVAAVLIGTMLGRSDFRTVPPAANGPTAVPPAVAPSTTAPGAPVPGPVEPAQSGPTSPAAPTGQAEPTGQTVQAALNRLDRLVDEGVSTGVIRDDVGLDLRNVIHNLRTDLTRGEPVDLGARTATLREKIATRTGEGGIGNEYATRLDAAAAELATAQ